MIPQYKVAGIVTCHNRKDKTVQSLSCLFNSADACKRAKIELVIFLTDDNSSDGTADAVISQFQDRDIHIIHSDGNAYWAGGMCLAWNMALKTSKNWDFYLLFNDDTMANIDAFDELLRTHLFAVDKYGKGGICSGLISSINDSKTITYGGKNYKGLFGRSVNVLPQGEPLECEMTNANLLLVSSEVVESMGIFDTRFHHACADWDYGIRARHSQFPVFVTGVVCGRCDDDHEGDSDLLEKIQSMSIKERKAYFSHPLRATADLRLFMKKHFWYKYLLVDVARLLNIYTPSLYYRLNNLR